MAGVASRGRTTKEKKKPRSTRTPAPWALGLVAVVAGTLLFLRSSSGSGAPSAVLATLDTSDQHALVFSPAGPNVVFFGHHNGIMRSDDAGRT